jgi:prolipoprotein diacylglyceryltransferase
MKESFFIFIGLSLGFFLQIIHFQLKKDKILNAFFLKKIALLVIFGIFCSKFLFSLTSYKYVPSFNGGFVFYGFLIPIFLVWFLSNSKDRKNLYFYNSIAIAMSASHAIGRLGCYLNSCCTGELLGIPVSILESLFLLGLFNYLRQRSREHDLFCSYVTLYALFRFTIEIFREDMVRGFVYELSTSQILSLFFLGAIILRRLFFERKTLEHKVLT